MCLAACGGAEGGTAQDERARQDWEALAGASFEVKILSDLGQETLEYTLDYVYNKEDTDRFTITSPEALAGISATIAGEDAPALTLQYEDTALDAPGPSRQGLTPADSVPCLLAALRTGSPAESWTESADGKKLTTLKYIDEQEDGTVTREVWLDGTAPVRAEVYWDGARVLTMTFSGWQAA